MKAAGIKNVSKLQYSEFSLQTPLYYAGSFITKGLMEQGTAKTPEHFLGSVYMSITPDFSNNTLLISLFNVTSLGSGGAPGTPSFIRPTNFSSTDLRLQPFTNISQTFMIRVKMDQNKLN